jgi:Peptidase family M23
LTQSFLQTIGIVSEKISGHPVLEAEQYKQKMNYILPVAGEWRVFNGGVTKETSHSWSIPSQRFAYDLVKYGQNGRSFDGDGRKLEDYFCFDAPIFSPADGMVVKARDGIRDAPHVGTFWMDWLTRNIAGNSVLIKHADGEYSLLAHLKRGSVQVKSGQTVKQGQEIGRCGHSGNSTEPHLHFQFQNGKSFYFSSGLPIKFTSFSRKSGEQKNFIEQDYISKNTFVSVGE